VLRQLAQVTVKAEQLGASMAKGEKVNTAELCTLASTIMRLSVRLGLEHNAKPKEEDFYTQTLPRLAAASASSAIED
jgi:hypothetical protein